MKQGRELPWRESRDPYRVWISEIMLQQTTVVAVVPYFERFLAKFPDVSSLAAADEHEVLRLWEGLGYYSRARNLHATARRIAEQGGAFPRTAMELHGLPGIGRYTAGAIASFAFDEPAPIVEANTLRLYSRLMAFTGDPRSSEGQQRLWSFASDILPGRGAGQFNHALMDLGATICTPKVPKCEQCPVRQNCQAAALGLQHELPRPAVRPKITNLTEAYVAVKRNGAYLLRQRAAGERWAGLWDFPRCELPDGAGDSIAISDRSRNGQKTLPIEANPLPIALQNAIESQVAGQTGIFVSLGTPFAELRHAVTRYRIRVICFEATSRGGRLADSSAARWVQPSEFAELALSQPGRRLARLLGDRTGG